jgi:hypothetical protein
MKLRVHQNAIRLRLTQSEVQRLASGESIEEQTPPFPQALIYRIETGDVSEIAIRFANGTLTVLLPREIAQSWAKSAEVGIESELPGSGGEKIRLLIEKDFHCLHGPPADREDCFPNPLAAVGDSSD